MIDPNHPALARAGRLTKSQALYALMALQKYDPGIKLALDRGDVLAAVRKAFTSRWAGLSKAVVGGLRFIVAADNGASYAELWGRGDDKDANWYAVTNAGIHEVSDITKGMPFEDALDRFLSAEIVRGGESRPLFTPLRSRGS